MPRANFFFGHFLHPRHLHRPGWHPVAHLAHHCQGRTSAAELADLACWRRPKT